jgi:hypothetical protein
MDERIKRSRAQERAGMRRFGGQVHGGSGSGRFRKNDGRTDNELIEFKRTDKRSITIKAADLENLIRNALAEGRWPVFGLEVGGRNYVILEESDYHELRLGVNDGGSGVDS